MFSKTHFKKIQNEIKKWNINIMLLFIIRVIGFCLFLLYYYKELFIFMDELICANTEFFDRLRKSRKLNNHGYTVC